MLVRYHAFVTIFAWRVTNQRGHAQAAANRPMGKQQVRSSNSLAAISDIQ